jgi:hypothetical protein
MERALRDLQDEVENYFNKGEAKGLDLTSPDDMRVLGQMLAERGDQRGIQATGVQQAINRLQWAQFQVEAAKKWTQGDNMAYAVSRQVVGENLPSSLWYTVAKFQTVADKLGVTLGELTSMDKDTLSKMLNPLYPGLTKLLGIDNPQSMMKLRQIQEAAAPGMIESIKNGVVSPAYEKQILEELKKNGVQLQGKSLPQWLNEDSRNRTTLAKILPKMDATLLEFLRSSDEGRQLVTQYDKNDELDKAAGANIATTTTAQIWADAFEHLFNNIVTAVNNIYDILPFGGGDKKPVTEKQRAEYIAAVTSPTFQKKLETVRNDEQKLRTMHYADPSNKKVEIEWKKLSYNLSTYDKYRSVGGPQKQGEYKEESPNYHFILGYKTSKLLSEEEGTENTENKEDSKEPSQQERDKEAVSAPQAEVVRRSVNSFDSRIQELGGNLSHNLSRLFSLPDKFTSTPVTKQGDTYHQITNNFGVNQIAIQPSGRVTSTSESDAVKSTPRKTGDFK